jgi:hypothetical protein
MQFFLLNTKVPGVLRMHQQIDKSIISQKKTCMDGYFN